MPIVRNKPPATPALPHLTRLSVTRCYGYWLMASGPANVILDKFPFEPASTANIRPGNVHEIARKAKAYNSEGRLAGRQLFHALDSSRDIGVILITRLLGPGGRFRDTDNQESSYKPFRDGLASGLCLKSDGPETGIAWIVDEARPLHPIDGGKSGHTRVSIWYSSATSRQQFEAWCASLVQPAATLAGEPVELAG